MKFCEKQVIYYHGKLHLYVLFSVLNEFVFIWCLIGCEIVGLEKIPKTGGAILVMYHGPYTFDLALLYINIYFKLNRRITIIGDPVLFRIPGNITSLSFL